MKVYGPLTRAHMATYVYLYYSLGMNEATYVR